MSLEIIQIGNPILRQVAREISPAEISSPPIQGLIQSMIGTMRAAPGVGLAAPQVGVSLQLIVIEDPEEFTASMLPEIKKERGRYPVKLHVLINPKLTHVSKDEIGFFEGCLSVKGYCRVMNRAKNVTVEYLDEHGEAKKMHASGWYARILQHEIDHLNGKLYVDTANAKTEIIWDEENKKKWLNASIKEIQEFVREVM